MRSYLYRCRVCGTEIWSDFIEMEKLTCERCHTCGKWLVMDVKDRQKI
jgi:DNA-directed RNA polymerase subunit RPC12/RpoP